MTPGTETRHSSGSPTPDRLLADAQTIILAWEETLVHGRPPRWLAVQRLLASAGLEVGLKVIAEADGRVTREEGGWEAFLMELAATAGLEAARRSMLARRLTSGMRRRSGGEHLFRDVLPALEAWGQAGRQLVVVGENARMEGACTRLGLARHLDAWQAAPGPTLAQPEFFVALLDQLNAVPGRTVLISNRPELELLGGAHAGIGRCVVLDRYGLYLHGGHPAYPVMPHL